MFTNEHNEYFVPGDACWVMTTCTGQSSVTPGEFIGMKNGKVQARVKATRVQYTNKITNKIGWDYQAWGRKELDRELIEYKRTTTLQLNRIMKRVV